ncbi:MAG: hypothetical protein GYB67_01115 [Chloroflexi bacterium]|nr:hypothetical protein [Chloroflexota bacterium]
MTTASTQQQLTQGATRLRRVVTGNGIFCISSGLVVALGAAPVAEFLGVASAASVFLIVGIGLIGYGAVVAWWANRTPFDRRLAWLATALDIAWVAGSLALILFNPFSFTANGRVAILLLAVIVAGFAVLQLTGLRQRSA